MVMMITPIVMKYWISSPTGEYDSDDGDDDYNDRD